MRSLELLGSAILTRKQMSTIRYSTRGNSCASKKPFCMDTEIAVSLNFYMSLNSILILIFFPQLFKEINIIPSSPFVQKQLPAQVADSCRKGSLCVMIDLNASLKPENFTFLPRGFMLVSLSDRNI